MPWSHLVHKSGKPALLATLLVREPELLHSSSFTAGPSLDSLGRDVGQFACRSYSAQLSPTADGWEESEHQACDIKQIRASGSNLERGGCLQTPLGFSLPVWNFAKVEVMSNLGSVGRVQ